MPNDRQRVLLVRIPNAVSLKSIFIFIICKLYVYVSLCNILHVQVPVEQKWVSGPLEVKADAMLGTKVRSSERTVPTATC